MLLARFKFSQSPSSVSIQLWAQSGLNFYSYIKLSQSVMWSCHAHVISRSKMALQPISTWLLWSKFFTWRLWGNSNFFEYSFHKRNGQQVISIVFPLRTFNYIIDTHQGLRATINKYVEPPNPTPPSPHMNYLL